MPDMRGGRGRLPPARTSPHPPPHRRSNDPISGPPRLVWPPLLLPTALGRQSVLALDVTSCLVPPDLYISIHGSIKTSLVSSSLNVARVLSVDFTLQNEA